MGKHETAGGGLGQAIADELAYAIQDIRQKVVEEPWFGRAVTPQMTTELSSPEASPAEPSTTVVVLSFEEAAGLSPLSPEPPGDALGRTAPERGPPGDGGLSFEEAAGLGACRQPEPASQEREPPAIER